MSPLVVIVLAILSTTSVAQFQNLNITDIPTCAQKCLLDGASEQSVCVGADIGCLCKNNDFVNVVACCLASNCDANEQTKAIAANVRLCSSANVSIPNYLGCSPDLASKVSASAATASRSTLYTQISQLGVGSLSTARIQSAVVIPTGGPVVPFTGRAIFTGSCTVPEFAMVTQPGGAVIEYPWAGCSNNRLACCPFDINAGGSLTVCPQDYTTTSDACCPIGWSVHTSSIGNQIPCVSTLSTPLTAPSVTGLRKRALTSLSKRAPVSVVVTSQVYTLKYALKSKKSGLSIGAKAGIGAGVGLAAIFGALFIALIIHKRKLRSQRIREGTIIGDGKYYGPARSDTFSNVGSHHPSHPGDLPSPASMRHMPIGGGFWLPPAAPDRPPSPPPAPVLIQELPASTHMHEHHPMFQSAEHESEHGSQHHPVISVHQGHNPPGSAGLVSPLEEPNRR
ncbi:MAG: hypothetical protein Q9197_005317 [Variospora fuerteventurae]